MNENGLSKRSLVELGIAKLGIFALFAFVLLQPCATQAAARKMVLTPRQARYFQVWSNYLAEGPVTWSRTAAPAFTPAIRRTIWDVLRADTYQQQLQNPMIDYLLWRRSLSPMRFTANHPYLSPQLAQLMNYLQPVVTVTPSVTPIPQVQVPPSDTTLPPTPTTLNPPSQQVVSPQTVSPPAVPEPGMFVLATAMIGCGHWWRKRFQQVSCG